MALTPTEQRKQDYIDEVSKSYRPTFAGTIPFRPTSLPLWAAAGRNEMRFREGMARIDTRLRSNSIATIDFDLTLVVRALHLSSSWPEAEPSQQATIGVLQDLYDQGELRFWLTDGETKFVYWTENHIILWLSSTWLLRPFLTFRDNDDAIINLERRLHHFLDTKLQYGAYEFFSTVYYRYTIGALLNLVDFATEPEIRDKATQVVDRLLKECMYFTTHDGSFFPVAARNHYDNYLSKRYEGVMYMLTGHGRVYNPDVFLAGAVGEVEFLEPFLATSTMDLEPVAAVWSRDVYVKLTIGHDIEQIQDVHSPLDRVDRVLFQWAGGAIAQSSVLADTKHVIQSKRLQDHKLLRDIGSDLIAAVPLVMAQVASSLLPGQTSGSDTTGAAVTVYKNAGVVLASLQDYLVGVRGIQQWPWMATVDGVALWTQAGMMAADFKEVPARGLSVNTHLPQVVQDQHVALIVYRPKWEVYKAQLLLDLAQAVPFLWNGLGLPQNFSMPTRVALRWEPALFDDMVESGAWIMGRRGTSYVAVWRHGFPRPSSSSSPPDDSGGPHYSDPHDSDRAQVWAVVVGTETTHGSFDAFRSSVAAGTVREHRRSLWRWILDWFLGWLLGTWRYKASVQVDGVSLETSL